MPLLTFTDKGIYCPRADVYIDPWKPVARALITHGHADHARPGSKHYLLTKSAAPVVRYRLGDISMQTVEYGETVVINGVEFSFHPAGHIIGSAQVKVAYKGEIWVASGDYKVEDDGLSEAFYPVRCHHFITESTFGLPVYHWEPQAQIMAQINAWWAANKAAGKVSLLTAYALGKAQRLLAGLDPDLGTIYTHGAVENTNEVLRQQGIELPTTTRLNPTLAKKEFVGNLVLATPGSISQPWAKKLGEVSVAAASGWMSLRGARRRRGADRGFVLSDHADWPGLLAAIKGTGAEHIYVTHGYTNIFSRYLQEQGWNAVALETAYGEEADPTTETTVTD